MGYVSSVMWIFWCLMIRVWSVVVRIDVKLIGNSFGGI